MGPAARYELRRNMASIMKFGFLCSIITVFVKKFEDNSFIEISITVLQKCKKSSQY